MARALRGCVIKQCSNRGACSKMERKQKGFSLIELLVVVTIILVIAAGAIPNLIRSRMSANEASAVASMRTVLTSEIVYSATHTVGFAANLTSLSDCGPRSNW